MLLYNSYVDWCLVYLHSLHTLLIIDNENACIY